MTKNLIAYTLDTDTSHLKGDVYDATLVRFDGWEITSSWMGTEPREAPNPVVFEADFEVIPTSDFPSSDVVWPLMSRRMLQILTSVGEFPHRVIPVRMVNRAVPRAKRTDASGELRPEVINDEFVAVQLLQHIDVVDWERSEFVRSRIDPDTVRRFSKLVLREPPGGLPPLFRIPAKISLLFVSAAAHDALQRAGIRGATFEPVATE